MSTLIEIENLGFSYDNKSIALQNITFSINHQTKLAIIGPSGSGKTTLVRSILGIFNEDLKISSGKILIDDIDLYKLNSRKRRNHFSRTNPSKER